MHGFFDIRAEVGDGDDSAKRWTFDQHRLTVIWLFDLDNRSRILFETSYEHGPELSSSSMEGKIHLPKAYWEFMASDAAKIRVGKFLPPFGIYNERHDATPTLIPTKLPSSVYGMHVIGHGGNDDHGDHTDSLGQKGRVYARLGTGLWLLGREYLNGWELEYHAYLINGRGEEQNEKDGNANKGIGGRLVVGPPGGTTRIGISAYRDRNDMQSNAKQQTAAVDLEFAYADFFLEGAAIFAGFEMTDSLGGLTGKMHHHLGYYVMAGYTFFDRLTPFAYYDIVDHDPDGPGGGETDLTVGINHNLRQSVYLKGEVHFRSFEEEGKDSNKMLITSLAVAF